MYLIPGSESAAVLDASILTVPLWRLHSHYWSSIHQSGGEGSAPPAALAETSQRAAVSLPPHFPLGI